MIDAAAPDSRIARSRWLYAPAVADVAISSWTARSGHFDWVSIWTLWALMLALLVFMIVIVLRSRVRATTLPPVWLVFALAFVTALGDFVTSVLLYTYDTRPLSLEILASLRSGDVGVAAVFGVFLMTASAAVFLLGSRTGTDPR